MVVLLASAGCSWLGPDRAPDDLDRGLAAAGEMENAHQYAVAREQIEAVAALTPEPRASELRMRACRTYGLEGNAQSERTCFANATRELQGATLPKDPDAAADARELEGRTALGVAKTDAELEQVVIQYAETDAARRALTARLADIDDCRGQVAVLDAVEPKVAAKISVADIAVRRANLLLKDCNDPKAALDAARHADAVAVGTHYLDDAVFVHAKAAEATGTNDEALDAYARIIATESGAWPFGSNDSLFLDDAWMAHGLLLEKLGRYNEATKSLKDLIATRPESRFHDDADRAIARMQGRR